MISESERRRPEFRDGYKVTLADGQEWTFPRPKFRAFPVEGPDGQITAGFRPFYGGDFDRMMAVFLGIQECTRGELFELRFRGACELLRRNYTLSIAELAELLAYEEDDPASDERWEAIDAILVGSPPKKKSETPGSPSATDPSPDGSSTA